MNSELSKIISVYGQVISNISQVSHSRGFSDIKRKIFILKMKMNLKVMEQCMQETHAK